MKKISSNSNSSYSWRFLILMGLLLLSGGLGIKVLFFSNASSQTQTSQVEKKHLSSVVDSQSQNKKKQLKVDLEKIYGGEITQKQNPFIPQQVKSAQFTYHAKIEKNKTPHNLKDLTTDIQLKGVINQTIALISYQGKTLLLKKGAEIGGYKITEITSDQVMYMRQGKKYISTISLKNK